MGASVWACSGNALAGNFPREIVSLADLSVLNLAGNDLTGAIPVALSKPQEPWGLHLSGKDLASAGPPELTGLIGLRILHLSSNIWPAESLA